MKKSLDAVKLGDRLREMFPEASGRAIKQWVENGRVRVRGRVMRRGDLPVASGDRIELGAASGSSFPSVLRLVFEDEEILVVDKPPGLLTIATERERERTAYHLLADYIGGHAVSARTGRPIPRLFIVHRLDRETSGLLVFAKSAAAKRKLQAQFEARAVERHYLAAVEGVMREERGRLRTQLRENRALRVRPTRDRTIGREAMTDYHVLTRGAETTLVELALVTGRRGQIRAQLAELGHPILGDRVSGASRDPLRRLCLHATRLGFAHPRGHRVVFESPAPTSFARLCAGTRRDAGSPKR